MSLVKMIYDLTKTFPDSERFGLVSQLKRSAVSIPSNIAEGAARRGTKEFINFLYISLGSLSELETQLEIALDLGYYKRNDFEMSIVTEIRRMIQGLIRSLQRK